MSTNLKIAICYSGAPRFYGNGLQLMNTRITGYEQCDYYVHLWKSEYGTTKEQLEKYLSPFLLKENHRIVSLEVEDQYRYNEKPWYILGPFDKFRWVNFFKMWYSIKQCDLLRQASGIDYDLVIRARVDIIPEQIQDLTKWYEISRTHVIVPDEYTSSTWPDKTVVGHEGTKFGPFCNDTFAITNPDFMAKYSSAFDYIDEFSKEGWPIHTETLCYHNLKRFNIPIHMMGCMPVRCARKTH